MPRCLLRRGGSVWFAEAWFFRTEVYTYCSHLQFFRLVGALCCGFYSLNKAVSFFLFFIKGLMSRSSVTPDQVVTGWVKNTLPICDTPGLKVSGKCLVPSLSNVFCNAYTSEHKTKSFSYLKHLINPPFLLAFLLSGDFAAARMKPKPGIFSSWWECLTFCFEISWQDKILHNQNNPNSITF